jgi:hypothetical protein
VVFLKKQFCPHQIGRGPFTINKTGNSRDHLNRLNLQLSIPIDMGPELEKKASGSGRV